MQVASNSLGSPVVGLAKVRKTLEYTPSLGAAYLLHKLLLSPVVRKPEQMMRGVVLQVRGKQPAEKTQLLSRTCLAQKGTLRAGCFPQKSQLLETEEEMKLSSSAKPERWCSLKVYSSSCYVCWKRCMAWMAWGCYAPSMTTNHYHHTVIQERFPRRKSCSKDVRNLLWSTTGYSEKSMSW